MDAPNQDHAPNQDQAPNQDPLQIILSILEQAGHQEPDRQAPGHQEPAAQEPAAQEPAAQEPDDEPPFREEPVGAPVEGRDTLNIDPPLRGVREGRLRPSPVLVPAVVAAALSAALVALLLVAPSPGPTPTGAAAGVYTPVAQGPETDEAASEESRPHTGSTAAARQPRPHAGSTASTRQPRPHAGSTASTRQPRLHAGRPAARQQREEARLTVLAAEAVEARSRFDHATLVGDNSEVEFLRQKLLDIRRRALAEPR